MKDDESPHPIDAHIGAMIRAERQARGMSQNALAKKLGVAFQQVQKYENGSNRVSASMLYAIACVFGVKISTFFPERKCRPTAGEAERLMATPGAPKLMKAFAKLDPDVQTATVACLSAFADKLSECRSRQG